ncbi:MAG: outer membrane protein assembly factor BamA [Paracoccaceae bacterium]|uniref:outer membrane protein assembly factor BamA n=1 Tax=Seohaeicola saemankumensis TaxID=481181 RepID=UPI001E4187E2|nr:outer membrane protein assembly factor BamA [Seohaeicola saemankumensis]
MTNHMGERHRVRNRLKSGKGSLTGWLGPVVLAGLSFGVILPGDIAQAQSYSFNSVQIDGNQRIEAGTILSYAGIQRGQTVSAAQLNDAYQRILGSGLFEDVSIEPRGGTLLISVTEFPTINRINFEGNRRLKTEALEAIVQSQSRRVFNPATAERDAAAIADAYAQAGRLAATVNPRIIRRSDNRVDLVFEIFEGGLVEIERIGFVGNRVFSDNRLRRVLETKQAGLLRAVIQRDTFIADRIEFDKQVLQDFYFSRGYVDFRTTAVNSQLARERDGFFITFNVQEGQQFRFGAVTTSTDLPDVNPDDFFAALNIREGNVYSPIVVENNISRLERLAIQKGLNFVRVEPRIVRNDRDLTLDVEFALVRGPRIFIERIDVEGNATTLDRVVRRQFRVAEGDPFNPREIRESAERIRALGFFSNAEVNAREGSSPNQVIVDVDVEEQPTGSLSFGGAYGTNGGFSLVASFSETNFLGRGQRLGLTFSGAEENQAYELRFTEPALLGRDLAFDFELGYRETNNSFADYDTAIARFSPGLTFPVSESGRLRAYYKVESVEISNYENTGTLLAAEEAQGQLWSSSVGYTYSYDNRRTGLTPDTGYLLQFGQEFAGAGGDSTYIKTTARAQAQTTILNDEVTLRASLEGGLLNFTDGTSRVTDRYLIGGSIMRGFAPDGIGPRERTPDGSVNDALGGNMYAVAKLEAEFPLGLPEEYGIRGGLFYDVGSVWDLDITSGNTLYEDFSLRHVVGVSILWDSVVGPLRFNFSKALQKEDFDDEQTFNLSVSTRF